MFSVEFCALRSHNVRFNVFMDNTPPKPQFLTDKIICDFICVHLNFDYLFKDHQSIVLHKRCSGCFFTSNVFLLSQCV